MKFFARKDRATSSGQVPVFMRIGRCSKDKQNIGGFKMKAFDYQRELMNEGKPITLNNFKAKEFKKRKYKVEVIDVKELNYEFIAKHEFWLKSVGKFDPDTPIKYLSNFKKIVHICIKNRRLTRDRFVGFKMAKREVERPFLVEKELNRIINKEFLMPPISQVRDIFIFCCYTGLAYADVEKLTREA